MEPMLSLQASQHPLAEAVGSPAACCPPRREMRQHVPAMLAECSTSAHGKAPHASRPATKALVVVSCTAKGSSVYEKTGVEAGVLHEASAQVRKALGLGPGPGLASRHSGRKLPLAAACAPGAM